MGRLDKRKESAVQTIKNQRTIEAGEVEEPEAALVRS